MANPVRPIPEGIWRPSGGTSSWADRKVALLDAAITLLREYRSALITAAVTGQIDVTREASCPPEPAPKTL